MRTDQASDDSSRRELWDAACVVLKLFVLAIPFGAILAIYFVMDPFQVLYAHPLADYFHDTNGVVVNRDFQTTEILLHNLAQGRNYDSFIFGSSRSLAYCCADWADHIGPARSFHMDGSAESLHGIAEKLEFLDARGLAIRNALIVLDCQYVGVADDHPGCMYIKHPAVSGESWLSFQATFLKGYLARELLLPFLVRTFCPNYAGPLPAHDFEFDLTTGDLVLQSAEVAMAREGESYWKNTSRFPPRDLSGLVSDPMIGEAQLRLLQRIKRVIDKHGTDVRIVLGPLYRGIRINPKDLATLVQLFGQHAVFDFSGVNVFSRDIHNYYEHTHYRPQVGRAILNLIYPSRRPT